MKETMYKYRIFFWLLLIIGVMAVVKWQYRDVKWEDSSRLITPTISPTSAPQINENYPLWELLPYQGKDFVADRYSQPLVLVVKIKDGDQKKITQEVYEWMRENKIATESHKLIFEKE